MKKNISSNVGDDRSLLFKRYLLWLYKTTKDECDKVERKFTQLEIDRQIEKILEKHVNACKPVLKQSLGIHLNEWKAYIVGKEADGERLKFDSNGQLDSKYVFLCLKKKAVEHIILARLGRKGLREIKGLYEDAAKKRILEDTSGQR